MTAAHIANVAALTPRGSANCDESTKCGMVPEATTSVVAATDATSKASASLTQIKKVDPVESTGSTVFSGVSEALESGMSVCALSRRPRTRPSNLAWDLVNRLILFSLSKDELV